MDQIERRHLDLARDLGIHIERRTRAPFHRPAPQRRRHPPDRRGQRPAARARDGERRTDGDAHRRRVPARRRHRRAVARRAHAAARRGAAGRHRNARTTFRPPAISSPTPAFQQRLASGGKVLITQGFIASDAHGDTVLLGRGGSDTSGSYFAAKLGARRLEIWTDVPGMFTSNPQVGAERAAAQVARLRRGAGNREQRRQGPAPALHPAGEAVRDPADRARHAAARARRHGRHRDGRRRRRARQGGLHQEGHHAGLDGDARHVAPGRLPRRCLRRVQGARPVGRPRVDVRDQRHRVARSGGQHARQPRARDAGDRACRSSAASRSSARARR